jgi:hypothetical protein
MSRMRRLVLVLCTVCFVATGCSSDPEATPRRSSSTPAPVATVAPTDAEKLEEGKDYEVVTTLPGGVDGHQVVWFGVDDGGAAYGEIIVPFPKANPGSMALSSYAQPILMSPEGELTRMTPVRDSGPPSQMTGADADDRWVTWLESASGSIGAGMWSLYSYERSTGTVRQLGSYRDRKAWKDSGLDYDGRPEIMGDDVVMGTSFIRSGDAILKAPLDGSAPLDVLLPDATAPDVDEDGFSHLRSDGTLMHRDVATGESRQIDGPTEQGMCQQYRSGVLLTCESTADGIVVRIVRPGGETAYGPFRETVTYAQIRDGWATFVADQGVDPKAYLVDLSDGTLFEVASSESDWALLGHGYASIVEGRHEFTKEPGPVVDGFRLITLMSTG